MREPVDKSTEMMMNEAFKTLPKKYHKRIPDSRTIVYPEPTPGHATGLKGRVAVMEAFEVNDEIQELILRNASEDQIFQVARKNGFMSMGEDAIIKALEHTIPYEEMNAFGTKLGVEVDLEVDVFSESEVPVDNLVAEDGNTAIMNINEDSAS